MAERPRSVILLSGGLDSATVLALARSQGFVPYTLTFRSGQRHAAEVAATRRIAAHLGVAEHREVVIDLRAFGGSALTGDLPVPKGRGSAEAASGIPVTYVPARNTIVLAYALAWAEVLGAADLFIGVNAQDHAGYPDCRPEYAAAFERLANLATREAVEGRLRITLHTPLLRLTKAEIVSAPA
jgi:7-cyano-7-deazaguanine synthase